MRRGSAAPARAPPGRSGPRDARAATGHSTCCDGSWGRVSCSYNRPMPLSDRQKKHLRRLGHELHPIVLIGQRGLTDSVIAEFDRALADHELVKLRARVGDREE